jgi:predicted  nucleic acid-binding Zn ribbon protein
LLSLSIPNMQKKWQLRHPFLDIFFYRQHKECTL